MEETEFRIQYLLFDSYTVYEKKEKSWTCQPLEVVVFDSIKKHIITFPTYFLSWPAEQKRVYL